MPFSKEPWNKGLQTRLYSRKQMGYIRHNLPDVALDMMQKTLDSGLTMSGLPSSAGAVRARKARTKEAKEARTIEALRLRGERRAGRLEARRARQIVRYAAKEARQNARLARRRR
jgi:hypothetical protein